MELQKYPVQIDCLCSQLSLSTPKSCTPIPPGGGDRRYWRLEFDDKASVIVAHDPNLSEAGAFVGLAKVFHSAGAKVPHIIGALQPDHRWYAQQDLGSVSLSDKLESPDIDSLVRCALDRLVDLQLVPEREWEDIVVNRPFSRRQIMWDLNYFKYEFLKPAGLPFDEDLLENDFESLADRLLDIPDWMTGFMMRDCQSRNIMLDPEPVFIDFQGGRKGPCIYDSVSLLWQAKAKFSSKFRAEMLDYYARIYASKSGRPSDASVITGKAPWYVLFRTLQVLGAYGFRGLVEHKAHFVESIPMALENLSCQLEIIEGQGLIELARVCCELVSLPRFHAIPDSDALTVSVFSFSYKKGYPEDMSGNGGGFMFDCRGMHNPGRYKEYKTLTGRDEPVKLFLKERGEADEFARKSFEIVAPSVSRYMQRGFKSLQIGFGCTGGQHRSVYCAEAVAKMVKKAFPGANVKLAHREQGIFLTL